MKITDKMRLDWLTKPKNYVCKYFGGRCGAFTSKWGLRIGPEFVGATPRAAIDAAMKSEKRSPK